MKRLPLLFLILSLPACSVFQSQGTRDQKRYERYVEKSRRDQAKRSDAIRQAQAEQIPEPQEASPPSVTFSTSP